MRFRDRTDAGQQLAKALSAYAGAARLLVLALPRGGVPVGFEVARALGAPLDVFVVRKLGVPGHEELAMGAIASGGVRILNQPVIESLSIPPAAIETATARELKELARREHAYRGAHAFPSLEGRTVLLVDDGIATGSTMRAAVKAIRAQHATRLIVAAPTASPSGLDDLEREADAVVTVMTPSNFSGVGQWYLDFTQTTDDEVRALLERARSGSEHAFSE
jgi:predicted phosphoribosyltransferase